MSEAAVSGEAEELEMKRERYIQDLQEALMGPEASYSFTLTPPEPRRGSSVTLAYEKMQKDISVSDALANVNASDTVEHQVCVVYVVFMEFFSDL